MHAEQRQTGKAVFAAAKVVLQKLISDQFELNEVHLLFFTFPNLRLHQ